MAAKKTTTRPKRVYKLLDKEDSALAAQQGWLVAHVVDERTLNQSVKILPIEFNKKCPHADAAYRVVYARAQNHDKLAQRALKLVFQGTQ